MEVLSLLISAFPVDIMYMIPTPSPQPNEGLSAY
jgi:hypothetical protein